MGVTSHLYRWIAAGVVFVLLFSLPGGCTARLKGYLKDATSPVHHFLIKTVHSLKEGVDTVRGFGGLLAENSRLSEELIYLQAKMAEMENLEQANHRLQEQLEFYNRSEHTLIPCQVTARAISSWWQSLRLDKGRAQGIEKQRAVISPDGLVGKTVEVSEFTTDVLLISDPACKVSARVARTGSFGLVTGRGVNSKGYPVARMQFIHKDATIKVGDAVVTSGLGGVFPKDILIGYIETVQVEDEGLYQIADVIPQAVTDVMDVVFVASAEEIAGVEE